MSLQNMYELLGMDIYSMYPQLAALHGLYPPNHLHAPLGSQPASLNMMSPPAAKHQQNTATVSPLTSPTNCVKSFSANTSLNASRTSSFAAALRKLAIQAKDPPENNNVSVLSSPRDTTSTSVSPPLLYSSMSLTTPPVVTIAPTQSHRALTSNDSRPTIERLHSNSSLFESAGSQADRPHSSASRDKDRALSRENHYQSSRRQTPHSTTDASSPMCARDESKRGFQPYRSVDEMHPPLPSSLVLDQATAAAAYSYPAAFLPPHTFPHPAFRFNDPFLVEQYRMMHSSYLSHPKGVIPHPSLHPLLAADAYFSPDMFSPHFAAFSQPNRIPEHRSPSMMSDRQQRTEEEKLEREKKHEKDYEMAIQQDRQRTLERETEKRERDKQNHKSSHTEYSSDGDKDTHKASRFGSIIQGTQKGLGIADRYPRVAMSSSSLNLNHKNEKRHSQNDENSHSEPSSPKYPSDDQDCLFSQVNPLRDGNITTRSHPTPLVSPQSQEETGPQSSKVSENSLFRPFGSQQLTNGLRVHSTDRKENILIYRSDTEKRQYLNGKNTNTSSDKDSICASDSKKSQSSSAFHSVMNRSSKSGSSSHNLLHYVSKDLSPSVSQRSYSTPINVPIYSASHLQSANHKDRMHGTLIESQNCIHKLDVEEKSHGESQADKSSCCCNSELDFNGDEQDEGKKLMISSEHALLQDNSPTKIKLPYHPGLSTFSHKKATDFERCRKRRRCTSEKKVSPVTIDEGPTVSSPLKRIYASEDLCKEPDFNQKCHFLSRQFSLEPVTAETKKVKEIILQACVEEKHRRLNLDDDSMDISIIDRFGVKRKLDVYAWKENDDRNHVYDPRIGGFQKQAPSANSRNFSCSSSVGDTSKVELNLWNNECLSVVNTNFVQEFHNSVLQTTRQKEVKRISVSDDLGVPAHNSLTPHMLPWLPLGLDTWPGVDVVMETYQKHDQGLKLEKHVLEVRNRQLKAENCHLNQLASHFSQRMEDMIHKKQQLDELRTHNQERIDHLKNAIRVLK